MPNKVDIDALFRKHRKDVLRFFARRTAEPEVALDLWAETFAQAVKSSGRFRGKTPESEVAWLFTIASNQLTSYLRKGYAEKRAMERLGIERPQATPELLAEIERDAGLGDVRREIQIALGSLTVETRSAVKLRIVDELPYSQVAAILEITEASARRRVSRGLCTLSKIIDPALLQEASQT